MRRPATETVRDATAVPIGVLAQPDRVLVNRHGALQWPHGPGLRWWIGGDDRWYDPMTERTVRRRLVDDSPVVETAMRVHGGDAIVRTYAVADAGGLVVVEVTNLTPSAFAVAFSGAPVTGKRPASPGPAPGSELPTDARVFPVPHRTALRVAVGLDAGELAGLPNVPGPDEVARGWQAQTAGRWRVQHPDAALAAAARAARSFLVLDQGASLASLVERWRLTGATPDPLVVAEAAARLAPARRPRAAGPRSADVPKTAIEHDALVGASLLLRACDESRAAGDVLAWAEPGTATGPLEDGADPALDQPWVEPARILAAERRRLVHDTTDGAVLLPGMRADWLGQPVEAYGIATRHGTVSFALRWHGERPALLWECDADVPLSCPTLDPAFRTTQPSGEALLGAPRRR